MINSFDGEYRFLSNFWPCQIRFDGMTYQSVEAAYQAAKTTDLNIRREFTQITAGQAKRKGRRLAIRPDWNDIRVDIMYQLVKQKFEQDPHDLLATGDQELIEGNTWGDTFWGICGGIGENVLGKILMRVRNDIAAESANTTVDA